MNGTSKQFVKVNNINYYVQTIGSGTPLILIMGLGAPGDKWEPNVEVYKNHFTCIMIDNVGTGQTDKPELESYSTTEMAKGILGIMDVLGIDKAHVNGISMGGAIAQKLAALAPERIISLILTSTFASVSVTFRRAIETLRDTTGKLDKITQKHLNQWMSFSQKFANEHENILIQIQEEDFSYSYPMPLYAYKAQCNACLSHNSVADLPKLTMPVLVAAGDSDLMMTIEKTMQLYEGIKQSSLYLCKDGGHVHQWEHVDAYNEITLNFLLSLS